MKEFLHPSVTEHILGDSSPPAHSPGRHFFRWLDSNAAPVLLDTGSWAVLLFPSHYLLVPALEHISAADL